MNQPKISVIITYYNEEKFLKNFLISVLNQSFSDIEIICQNNGSTDSSEEIVKKFAAADKRIKLINIPEITSKENAQKMALGVASGEFVCFIEVSEALNIDFLRNLYLKLVSDKNNFIIESNHLYRRAFLENSENVNKIIKEKMIDVFNHSCESLENQKKDLRIELDDFYQKNKDYINDKTYDIFCKFNSFSEDFKLKEEKLNLMFENAKKELKSQSEENYKKVNKELNEIREYVDSEINRKGCDINKAFEEISTNYEYTEKLVEDNYKKLVSEKDEINKKFSEDFNNKIKELEENISASYLSIKRLLDINIDSINLKLASGNCEPENTESYFQLEKILKENIDKMYVQINKFSNIFYEEISKLYKEFSDKQIKNESENKFMFEKMLGEMKEEIIKELSSKIQTNESTDN